MDWQDILEMMIKGEMPWPEGHELEEKYNILTNQIENEIESWICENLSDLTPFLK